MVSLQSIIWVFLLNNFSRVINLLLTKLARDRPGRISALGLFCTDLARSLLSRPRADILPVRPSCLVNKIYIFYIDIFLMINSSSDRLPLKLCGMPCNQLCLFIAITFHTNLAEAKNDRFHVTSSLSKT